MKIEFEDRGQDFLMWELSEPNEAGFATVMDCQPFQGAIWMGCLVDCKTVEVGSYLDFYKPPGYGRLRYKITKIS